MKIGIMTFNILNNSPCLEIDGKELSKVANHPKYYVISNRIIILNNCDNYNKMPELINLIFNQKFLEKFLISKLIPNEISLNNVIPSLTCQFKINQFKKDFHIIKYIGQGRFGRVYSAISNIDLQMYAIKKVIINCSKLNKKEIADALKEFRILAKFDHSNIARYHTAWFEQINNNSDNNIHKFHLVLYIQMELCHFNLKDWLVMRNKPYGVLQKLDMANSRSLANQLLKGVAYIHSNKTTHGNIKPTNIFITIHSIDSLQLKIGDIGLSKLFENTGTSLYIAPEVSNPNHKLTKYNHKCDLYSVGVILLELMYKFTSKIELFHVISISDRITYKDLRKLWPLEAPHVCNLVSVNPENRDEADDLLNIAWCFNESYAQKASYEYRRLKFENKWLRKETEILLEKLF